MISMSKILMLRSFGFQLFMFKIIYERKNIHKTSQHCNIISLKLFPNVIKFLYGTHSFNINGVILIWKKKTFDHFF